MTERIDRRALMRVAGYGLGGLLLPGGQLAAQTLSAARGFTHNVASGEPGADSMLLWTRYVPGDGGAVKLRAEIAEDADFTRVVSGGQMVTGPWRDHTAKITVDGLAPGKRYHYRFIAPDGSFSPVGRTKTLPAGKADAFRIAVFSCSNMPFGFFNAYGHAAARGDIDLALHMGDYIYEYHRGGYDKRDFPRANDVLPATEILSIADYRLRYASYRSDPDLQALHQSVAMIANTDDHEAANDAWEGGAQNHGPFEGDWNVRRAAAMQVWREWMPVGEQPWKAYDIGGLATYFRTDSRMVARSRPDNLQELLAGKADMAAALKAYRDGPWQDPAATMFGTEQENWLTHGMAASVRAKRKWQIVGSGTIMGQTYMPSVALDWFPPGGRGQVQQGLAAAQLGLPFFLDNWGGYPQARSRLLKAALNANANLVMVAGDSHNAWAYDLAQDKERAGVEFDGHSVSSPGFEYYVRADPALVSKGLRSASPELRWADTSNRGYMVMTLTAKDVTNDWVMMETTAQRALAVKPGHQMRVRHGEHRLEAVA